MSECEQWRDGFAVNKQRGWFGASKERYRGKFMTTLKHNQYNIQISRQETQYPAPIITLSLLNGLWIQSFAVIGMPFSFCCLFSFIHQYQSSCEVWNSKRSQEGMWSAEKELTILLFVSTKSWVKLCEVVWLRRVASPVTSVTASPGSCQQCYTLVLNWKQQQG